MNTLQTGPSTAFENKIKPRWLDLTDAVLGVAVSNSDVRFHVTWI
jgi:hypothetical protein